MAHIKTYCRVKPSGKNYDDYDVTSSTLYVRVPDHYNPISWGVNVRAKSVVNHEFKFNGIFRDDASQEEVFTTAASGIVDGFLNGYNGTIFAYGQTGTGKTFTVEGTARMYQDRGLAPRSLSMIYKTLASRQSDDIEVHVSYMEIYQEIGYDLLNTAARTNSVVTPFPKVAVVEGAKGSCIIRNLSTHLAANEDVAQSLLLQGQANRKIAETPMNQRSSRSHAVFTIYLTVKGQDSDIVTKSKLNLVDLAGSERVSKTGTIGLQLSEAKYINLSLHHLEGVIVALQREVSGQSRVNRRPATASSALDYKLYNRWVESQKPSYTSVNKFIPYRNSLLTMVLRDSLGGNCQTSMIATISLEPTNLSESISTCRFSQRVACVTNTLRKNEEIDDRSMIKRLRKKIAELESEISFLRSDQGEVSALAPDFSIDSKLTDEDKLQCAGVVEGYVRGRLKDPIGAGVNSVLKFRECLRLFKSLVLSHIDLDRIPAITAAPANVLSKSCEDLSGPKSAWEEEKPTQNINQSESRRTSTQSAGDRPKFRSNVKDKNQPIKHSPQLTHSQSFSHTPSHPYHISPNPFMTDKPYKPKLKNGKHLVQDSKGFHGDRSEVDSRLVWENGAENGAGWSGQGRDSRPGSSDSLVGRGQTGNTRSSSAPVGRGQPVSGKSVPYKTPFERKKEQEILKLDKKIEKANATISSQKQDLRDMQGDIRDRQLRLLRQEVSTKVERSMEQLADQHAYIQRLKKSGTDSELIQQEELVKKQLLKRQHKMEKRLGAIDQELCTLKDMEGQGQVKVEAKSSGGKSRPSGVKVEEKYSDYMRRDGKIDSRKVMGMLQCRDKRQEKLQDKLEFEKQMALSTQVELKEVATRHKLQEFRERLKQRRNLSSGSSMFSFDDTYGEQPPTFDTSGHNNTQGMKKAQTSPLKAKSEVLDNRNGSNGVYNTTPTREVAQSQSDVKSLASCSLVSSEVFTDSMASFDNFNEHHGDVTRKPPEMRKNPLQSGNDVHRNKKWEPGFENRPDYTSSTSSSSLLHNWIKNNNSLKSSLSDLEKLRATSTPQMKVEPSKQWDNAYSTRLTHSSFDIGAAKNLDSIHSHGIQFSSLQEAGYEDIPFGEGHSDSQPSEHGKEEDSDIDEISLISSSRQPGGASTSIHQPKTNYSDDPFGNGYFSQGLQTNSSAKDPFSPGYFKQRTDEAQKRTSSSADDYETESNASIVTLKGQISGKPSNSTAAASVTATTTHNQRNKCNGLESEKLNRATTIMGSVENITDNEKTQILEQSNCSHSNTDSGQNRKEPFKRESKPEFDGRKLGLEHRNFDEALSKMLGVSPAPTTSSSVAYSQQQYDVYARTTNKPSSVTYKGRMGKGADTKSSSSLKSSSTWGPEARNLSIVDRLSSYLENSSVFEEKPKAHKGRSFDDSDLAPHKRTTVTNNDHQPSQTSNWMKTKNAGKVKPEIDLDKFKVTIKALGDEEREETYMRSARAQKNRVQRIRQARTAAEVIQKYWRKYKGK